MTRKRPELQYAEKLWGFDVFEGVIQIGYNHSGGNGIPCVELGRIGDWIFHGHGIHPALDLFVGDVGGLICGVHRYNFAMQGVAAHLWSGLTGGAEKRQAEQGSR